jgi:AsmA protein
MRLKVPFFGYALAGIAFLLPSLLFVAVLPFLINAQPIRAKLVREIGNWTGGEVSVAGSVSVQDFFSLSVEAQNVEIGRFKGIAPIESMKADRIIARIAWFSLLSGNFDFDKVKIYGAVMKVRADGPRDAWGVVARMISGRQATPFAVLYLDDALIAMRAGKGQPYRRLEVTSALLRTAKSGRQLISSASLVWKNRPVSLTMRSAFNSATSSRMPLRLSVTSDLLTTSFDGEATLAGLPDAEGVLNLRSPDLAAAAEWLEVDIGAAAIGHAVSASGDLTLAPEQITLTSAQVGIAGQTAQAAVTLKRGEQLPRLEGVLAFDHFDATPWLAKEREGSAALPSKPFHIPIESDVRISAKTLSWNGVTAGPTALAVSSGPERLTAEIAELGFLGGEVRGNIALDMTGEQPRISARLTGERLDAAGFLGLTKQRDWLTGEADVNAEAEATLDEAGNLFDRVMAHARVNFPEGGQMRLDIPRIATSGVSVTNGWDALDLTNAAFDRLRFDITLQAGQISFANVVLAAAGRQMSGRGDIDLAARSLDWRINILPPEAADTNSGVMAKDASVAGPRLSIKGPWTSPTIRRDGFPTSGLQTGNRAAGLEVSLSGR